MECGKYKNYPSMWFRWKDPGLSDSERFRKLKK